MRELRLERGSKVGSEGVGFGREGSSDDWGQNDYSHPAKDEGERAERCVITCELLSYEDDEGHKSSGVGS